MQRGAQSPSPVATTHGFLRALIALAIALFSLVGAPAGRPELRGPSIPLDLSATIDGLPRRAPVYIHPEHSEPRLLARQEQTPGSEARTGAGSATIERDAGPEPCRATLASLLALASRYRPGTHAPARPVRGPPSQA